MCSYELEFAKAVDHVDLSLDDIALDLKVSDLVFNQLLKFIRSMGAGHLDQIKLSRDGVSIFRCLRLEARVGVRTYSREVVRLAELVDIVDDVIH